MSTNWQARPPQLDVLSVHLTAAPCHVGCEFCYLGARLPLSPAARLDPSLIAAILGGIACREVAVALNEADDESARALQVIAGRARELSCMISLTTTPQVILARPMLAEGITRLTLSVDARKGVYRARELGPVLAAIRGRARELILMVTLDSPTFAEELLQTELLELLKLPEVDCIALNALKPLPAWCGRDFWLAFCARAAPLLKRYLGTRLFLDCTVMSGFLGLGECPGRADISPGPEFRRCVYQSVADFSFTDHADFINKIKNITPLDICPFVSKT